MAKQANAPFAESRKQKIVKQVNLKGEVNVSDLCDEFQVSPATIRNDLNELERFGLLLRTHGGAMKNTNNVTYELTSQEKTAFNLISKKAIAKAGLAYIKSGAVIALDTGTTTLELAKLLQHTALTLTVLTNDLLIAACLERNNNITVMMLGGTIRRGFHCTTGNMLLDFIGNLSIDIAFIATNAINTKRGLSTPNIDIANVKRKMIQISHCTILLADSSKIGANAFASFAKLSEIDYMITDDNVTTEFANEANECGMELVKVLTK